MSTIFCDEAGNSGAHLLDPEQPFFVLASNNFSSEEASSLLEHVRSAQSSEPKYKTLRRSSSGIDRLMHFVADERLMQGRVAVNLFHKPFMVVTKLVDLIMETLHHLNGQDLYVSGENQARSNMLHQCLPQYCGTQTTHRYLEAFVELVRRRGDKEKAEFFAAGEQMRLACTDEDFLQHLVPLVAPELFPYWFNDQIDSLDLDPAIPALFAHIVEWGRRTSGRFDIVHDDSKPILASQATFESMLALGDEPSMLIGYDRRKFDFPLRARSLSQESSAHHPQLQVADLCAGLINHLLKCRETGQFDELAKLMQQRELHRWVFDGVMPSLDITPEELGTVEDSVGVNPVDAMLDHLERKTGRASDAGEKV